jgi:LysR family transcriptional regulator, nitrogen assimilation regulatory protein
VELLQLRLFSAIASNGSFSRAATLFGSTQSSVSKSISALEQEWSIRLFNRTGRGADLTPAGRALLPKAEALLADADELASTMAQWGGPVAGTVRLWLLPSVSTLLVHKLLVHARASYPGIHLQVSEGTTQVIEEALADGRCDLGVLSRIPSADLADSKPLLSSSIVLVANPAAAQARLPSIPFRQAAALPLVLASTPNNARLRLEQEARRQKISLNVAWEVNPVHLAKEMVVSERLYMMAARLTVATEVAAGVLAAVPVVEPEIQQNFYLVTAGRRSASAAVRAVADLVGAVASEAAGGNLGNG